MGFLTGFIIIAIVMLVSFKLSRFFSRTAFYLEERQRYKSYHDKCIRESLFNISASVGKSEEDPVSIKQRLLSANQEIIEKKKLDDAIRDELEIDI